MFLLKYLFRNLVLMCRLLARGEWRRVVLALYARLYVRFHGLMFPFQRPGLRARNMAPGPLNVQVITQHPVAFSSPDHQVPHGTKYNNSTNRKFVTLLNRHCRERFPRQPLCFMDLGCSGGQLVADFHSIHWLAVGLEGSDYSLKHRRANWRQLAGRNLFTCDISKPFQVHRNGSPLHFHLITAWEVMEHIAGDDLVQVFTNIRNHLAAGGLFIASTSSSTSIVDGVELHQTRMTNTEWHQWIQARFPDLRPADLGLRVYQHVRFDFGEPSFLVYQRV